MKVYHIKYTSELLVKQLTNLCGESSEFLFIDGSLINGVRDREVDKFTETTKTRKK